MFTWYYVRVSGILMLVFVLGHLFIMHYQHAPAATGTAFVDRRWADATWRVFDWVLLMLALTHGALGAYGILCERIMHGRARAVLDAVVAAGTLGFASLGTAVVICGPRAPGSGPGPLSAQTWIPAALIAGLAALATATYLAALGAAAAFAARAVRRSPIGWWTLPGQWAFVLNRIAGIGVFGFLLIHILDVSLVPFAPDLYDRTVAGYALPYLMPMEVLLVAAVVYHAFNGLRLMTLEMLDRRAVRAHGPSFVIVVVVTVLLLLPSVAVLLGTRP